MCSADDFIAMLPEEFDDDLFSNPTEILFADFWLLILLILHDVPPLMSCL